MILCDSTSKMHKYPYISIHIHFSNLLRIIVLFIFVCNRFNKQDDGTIIILFTQQRRDGDMRIKRQCEDINEYGYQVVGNITDCEYSLHDSSNCEPILMSLLSPSNWNDIAPYIKVEQPAMGLYEEFNKEYIDILSGCNPDWQLGEFRVYMGMIALYFGKPATGESGILWIKQPEQLKLKFELFRTSFGFKPIYEVELECQKAQKTQRNLGENFVLYKNKYIKTRIHENLGYTVAHNFIKLKDPKSEGDDFYHCNNSYIDTTEYIGI